MPVIELMIPALGESISSVTFAKWLKPDGAVVQMDEPICEIETEKANQELTAEKAGKLSWVAKEGEDLNVGALFGKIDTDANAAAAPTAPAAASTPAPPPTAPAPAPAPAASAATGHPSPAAAKILTEGGIPPTDVNGSGVGGRITKEDAEKAVANKAVAPVTAVKPAPPAPAPVSTAQFSRDEHRQRMSRMRRTIAKRLVSAKNNTAMLTTFNEVDMTGIMNLRETYQEAFVAKYGIKLGFMSLFAKACAKVLLEMPDVNAMIDGEDVIYHDFADISIAISTPNGLVVPPVRNVESLKFHEVELKIKEL
jgi:2-oxoglutarate dehydrogenase E2 component (dihydrolipoamide succinyltransferase)